MKKICVYCGSSPGINPAYADAAEKLGVCLAANGIELVYGGSDLGLMGILSDTVRKMDGKVTAVMPMDIRDRTGHAFEDELIVTDSMHARKQKMFDEADAFIALPGGFGTLDEMFEMLTWSQLGYHVKPCGFLNVAGYFDSLLQFLDEATARGFVSPEHRSLALSADSIPDLMDQLRTFQSPLANKFSQKPTS